MKESQELVQKKGIVLNPFAYRKQVNILIRLKADLLIRREKSQITNQSFFSFKAANRCMKEQRSEIGFSMTPLAHGRQDQEQL